MAKHKVSAICTDYDETLITEDTTERLLLRIKELTPQNQIADFNRTWNDASIKYRAELAKIYAETLTLPFLKAAERLNYLSNRMNNLEIASSAQAFPLFRHITKERLRREGVRIQLLLNAKKVLKEFKKNGLPVYVISLNWSRDIIEASLSGVVETSSIFCNNIVFRNDEADGGLELCINSPQDKYMKMKSLAAAQEVAYVGNGVNDILCVLSAKYGFIINPQNPLFQLLESVDVRAGAIKDPSKTDEPGIYLINSWDDVKRVLTS